MPNPSDRLAAALADCYRIERELGQGGMAAVYLAQDLKHDRKVALKVLKPELAAVLGAERFVEEIKTTASLQHPHILPLFDSGTADGFLFYVMPFIEGETLRDKLNRDTQLGLIVNWRVDSVTHTEDTMLFRAGATAIAIAAIVTAVGCRDANSPQRLQSGPAFAIPTGPYTPGQSYFGRNNYIEYVAGNSPVIYSAPHGGALTPSEIPDRTAGNCGGSATTGADLNTVELIRAMQARHFARFGTHPHIIINHLARRKLDANRTAEEAACGDAEALIALGEWHDFINVAKAAVLQASSRGWYMDMHGHGHSIQRLELGYLLTGTQLDLSNASLDANAAYEDTASMRTVSESAPPSFSTLLRGTSSLGTLYANNGFPSVPSTAVPGPAGDSYFSGGDNTRRHTCGAEATAFGGTTAGNICGVQIEANFTGVRDNSTNRDRFGDATAVVLEQYLALHWGLTLGTGSPPSFISVTLRGYKVKGAARVDLTWSGATGSTVDIQRNGVVVTTTPNDGAHTDILGKVSGTFTYRVCNTGTTTCSTAATVSLKSTDEVSNLTNADLAPTTASQRTWRWYHFAALWIGMVMCIPAYTLSASLIESGMSAWQAVFTVFVANGIVLVPMLLIGHAGTKYGIPYAVLARASFGTIGARLPALMRAIVACGWYGIQTWVCGSMIYTLLGVLRGAELGGVVIPGLGINSGQLICFLAFWAIQFWYVVHGMDSIRRLETWTAPLKIVICFVLLGWAYSKAGGFGTLLQQPSQFVEGGAKAGQFWGVFWPSLTAMVGFWATLALNIPDFTRFARTQRDQVLGQSLGLPVPMGLLALLAVIVTSATVVLYGQAIWDPVDLASRMTGAAVLLALIVLLIDTVSVNLAANLVGPAYDFSALWPRKISYRAGGFITASIALVMMPWKILASTQGYIFTWLIGYSALLGPIAGVLIVDYYMIRRTRIDVDELYRPGGQYSYTKGWNPAAIIAFVCGVAPNIPGFLHAAFPNAFSGVRAPFTTLYDYAWFVGLAIAALVYAGMMKRVSPGPVAYAPV